MKQLLLMANSQNSKTSPMANQKDPLYSHSFGLLILITVLHSDVKLCADSTFLFSARHVKLLKIKLLKLLKLLKILLKLFCSQEYLKCK